MSKEKTENTRKTIVTRDGIKALEAERPQLNAYVDYTIGGAVETHVHASLHAMREGQITRGWKTLQTASDTLRHDQPAARLPGYAKAAYIEAQKKITAGPKRQKDPARARSTKSHAD